jgi:mono/diheme cytochrome c family protein
MWATNAKIVALSLAVIGFYTLVAHIIPQLQSEVPAQVAIGPAASPEELAAAGERIYSTVCTACHGLGTRAPHLVTDHGGLGPIGARCLARLGDGCKEYLYRSLIAPGDSVVAGFANIMPDMRTQLDANQLWAVIAYLQSQGGEITVTFQDLEAAAAASGQPAATAVASSTTTDPRELLREKGCLGCHPIDGTGPPIGPSFDGIGSRLNREQIREGILDPNATVAKGYEQFAGMMPPNFGDQLTAAQLEAIVDFLAGRR